MELAESGAGKDDDMKSQNPRETARRVFAVAALTLITQGAIGSEAAHRTAPEVVRVTAQTPATARLAAGIEIVRVTARRPGTVTFNARIESDAAALIDAMNRHVDEDRERRLEEIAPARMKLALSEVATRG